MKLLVLNVFVLIVFSLLYVCTVSAGQLEGSIGISKQFASGWLDLKAPTSFKKGEKLKIFVGGTAKKILIRFLPKNGDPDTPIGIDGGPKVVPDNRIIEVVLESDHDNVVQISVHGGSELWGGLVSLGENNGPATLVTIERLSEPLSEIESIVIPNDEQTNPTFVGEKIILIRAVFAAKGNESDKDGFVKLQDTGSYLPENIIETKKLPAPNVSQIEVDFWGGHFANDFGSGYVTVEFYDDTLEKAKIGSIRFDIDNLIEDPAGKLSNWQIYKSIKYLQHFNKIIDVQQKNISGVKIFVNPGNWAVVIRDFQVKVR